MKDKQQIKQRIIDLSKNLGFDDCYFTQSPQNSNGVTLLLFKKYMPSLPDKSCDKASISQYYFCSNKGYFAAKDLCTKITEELGISAQQNKEIALKKHASNYGGMIGLNSLYYHKNFGSFIAMQAIDLDITLPLTEKKECKSCKKCMACAKVCPTGAIDENGFHREKCLRNMLDTDVPPKYRSNIIQLIGCDLCQIACPMNSKDRVEPTSFDIENLINNKETKLLKSLCGSNFVSKTRIVSQSICIAVNKNRYDSIETIKKLMNDDIEKLRIYAKWAYENLKKDK